MPGRRSVPAFRRGGDRRRRPAWGTRRGASAVCRTRPGPRPPRRTHRARPPVRTASPPPPGRTGPPGRFRRESRACCCPWVRDCDHVRRPARPCAGWPSQGHVRPGPPFCPRPILDGMGTPLGDFVRTRRDSIQPESLGLPEHGRRRSSGLRRLDLAARAGISVEYLTRIEQGRDRNPSVAVVNALADALALDPTERAHLRYLAKITGGECVAHRRPAPPRREVRPSVLETLRLL